MRKRKGAGCSCENLGPARDMPLGLGLPMVPTWNRRDSPKCGQTRVSNKVSENKARLAGATQILFNNYERPIISQAWWRSGLTRQT